MTNRRGSCKHDYRSDGRSYCYCIKCGKNKYEQGGSNMDSKKRKKSLVGWTLKKPFLVSTKLGWCYIDDGKNTIPICCRNGFEKGISLKMFKKVRITIEEI